MQPANFLEKFPKSCRSPPPQTFPAKTSLDESQSSFASSRRDRDRVRRVKLNLILA
jgi:hypothetical protein